MSAPDLTHGDLTRWNRAGLSKLDYIDGNAATYLEDLRLALRTQFSGDPAILSWLGEAVTDQNQKAWLDRLLTQYQDEKRDYAWELIRTFARATHILAHTMDAYANERYLGTATQWESIRRLVKMLDYQPAPPASAETRVALFVKSNLTQSDAAKSDDYPAAGLVEQGLAIKNKPLDGSSPLVFETLSDLEVDYRLNQVRVFDYDRSPDLVSIPPQGSSFLFETIDETSSPASISVGDRGVLISGLNHVAVSISDFDPTSILLSILEHEFSGEHWTKADLELHLSPKWDTPPKLNGPNVIEVDPINGQVSIGDVLLYKSGSQWLPRKVLAIEGNRIKFNASVSPSSSNTVFYKAVSLPLQTYGDSYQVYVAPIERETDTLWDQALNTINADYEYVVDADGDTTADHLFHYVWDHLAAAVYYLPKDAPALFTATQTSPETLAFEGKVGALNSEDWCILQNTEDQWFSHQIDSIASKENTYSIRTLDSLGNDTWQFSNGQYAKILKHKTYNENHTPAFDNASDTQCELQLLIEEQPEALTTGRALWVVSSTDAVLVKVTKIISIDPLAGTLRIRITPSLQGRDFPKYDTWIYANVVKAGHGEGDAVKVLGNGNRVEKNQTFAFQKTGIAFEQDTEFSSGVRAAVTIRVDNRRWTQVDTLRNATATDTVFTTGLNESGQLMIQFGDGVKGQRLPTGTNNVTIQARLGHGLQGNLSAGSLNKLKKNHALVDQVFQPAPATGGGNLESTDSLKQQAPASVLTLDRAVSIADYAHLAQRQSSVWQARAFELPDLPGATDRIEVILVPAGGGGLGALAQSTQSLLLRHSRPGVKISIQRFEAILLALVIRIRVDTEAYDGDWVTAAVESALIQALSLEQATLGESLYRSDLYQIIEGVEGVENLDISINPNGFMNEDGVPITPKSLFIADDQSIRRVSPSDRQLIYLNTDIHPLDIDWEAADA